MQFSINSFAQNWGIGEKWGFQCGWPSPAWQGFLCCSRRTSLSEYACIYVSIFVNTVLLRGCVLRQRRLILLLAGLYLLYICIEKIQPCILAGQSVYGNHLQTGVCSHGVCPFLFAFYKKQMLFICVCLTKPHTFRTILFIFSRFSVTVMLCSSQAAFYGKAIAVTYNNEI